MSLFWALAIPVIVLGFVYLLIVKNNGMPAWLENFSENHGSIWTYGVITIAVISLIKYASEN